MVVSDSNEMKNTTPVLKFTSYLMEQSTEWRRHEVWDNHRA